MAALDELKEYLEMLESELRSMPGENDPRLFKTSEGGPSVIVFVKVMKLMAQSIEEASVPVVLRRGEQIEPLPNNGT